jgi:phosphatidylserine decarboxylase
VNPVWNDIVFFNVKKSHLNYALKASVYDFDTVSGNDFIGKVNLPLQEILDNTLFDSAILGPQETSLFDKKVWEREVLLELDEKYSSQSKLKLQFSFVAYKQFRHHLWQTIFSEYDMNKSNSLNKIEFDAALEGLLLKPVSSADFYKKCVGSADSEFPMSDLISVLDKELFSDGPSLFELETNSCCFCRQPFIKWNYATIERGEISKEKRVDMFDIINHLGVCMAKGSKENLRTFLLGGYLTEAYAQRGWYSRMATYVTFGSYTPEKANANILVQRRDNGEMMEEKMPTYIRLGIRLLYQDKAGKFVFYFIKISC